MEIPSVRLGFFKLNMPEMASAPACWREAFGFEVTIRLSTGLGSWLA